MSTAKQDTKLQIIKSTSYGNSGPSFQLKPTRMEQVADHSTECKYVLTRTQVKKLLKLAATAPTTQYADNSVYASVPILYREQGKWQREIARYEIVRNKGGVLQIGCSVFSARAVKTVRQWAGV